MVSRKIDWRKTVGIPLLVVLLVAGVILFNIFWKTYRDRWGISQNDEEVSENVTIQEEKEPEKNELPERIDFQTVLDEWGDSIAGSTSMLVYDLDRDEMVGAYNSNASYNIASLYKLFVVLEGYRRVQSEEWNENDSAGVTGYTISECLDLAIRESHSPCAETLWGLIGRDELDEIISHDFNITNSNISSLVSNPEDILKIMKVIYQHNDIKDETLMNRLKDSLLNQPATTYNWRQGLPSGFSEANVYNKVGWDYNDEGGYWNVYHDAAIVEFPDDNRHFIVVVMTQYVPYQNITELGRRIEKTYLESK